MYCFIHKTRGAGSNVIPYSALTEVYKYIFDSRHITRSEKCTDRVEVGVSIFTGSPHLYVVVVLNGEEVLLVVVTLSKSNLNEYQRQKFKFVFLYWSSLSSHLSCILCFISTPEFIALMVCYKD